MTTKSEWQSVNESLMAGDRKRLGEPPTADEVFAYMNGDLSPEEETRVRERLVCYPELARTLTAPFPTEGASPGDDDYLNDAELATHWAALQRRRNRARVVPFWPVFGSIAAALAIVFAGLFWRAESELKQPRAASVQESLLPDGQRGGVANAAVVKAVGDSFFVALQLHNHEAFKTFRLQIVDANQKSLWKSDDVQNGDSDVLAVLIPSKFLKAAEYQIVLFGVNGAREERLGTYSLRIP
jgi:hypothetical protein